MTFKNGVAFIGTNFVFNSEAAARAFCADLDVDADEEFRFKADAAGARWIAEVYVIGSDQFVAIV